MRFVSVIMAAVMSMSAMSALAAGASAEEVNEPFDRDYYMHSLHDFPVFIHTAGICSKLKSFSITVDYEFILKPWEDSPVTKRVLADHPEAVVSQPDESGNVIVKIHEKHTISENTGANTLRPFEFPSRTDINSIKIRLDYNSKTLGEREICKFDIASLNLTNTNDCDILSIYFDYDSFSSMVTGDILVNGNWVFTRKR